MSMLNNPSDLQRKAHTADASHSVSVFSLLLIREARLLIRRPAELANPLVFFAIVIALFPLAVGPQTELLKTLSPGLLWVAALLAVLLSLDGLFRSDFEDGSLEQWVLSSHPLPLLALTKVLAHWLFSGLALVLLAPLLALMLGLPARCLPVLLLSLLLGTPVLSLLGAIGAALTVGLKRGGLLLALLILPLYIPVLILGSGALQADLQGLPTLGHLLWMASLTALTITLSPFAIAAGLSISVGE
jgi:heme exporter protein B